MGPLPFFIFPGPFLPLFSPYSVKVLMDKSGAWMGVRAPRFFDAGTGCESHTLPAQCHSPQPGAAALHYALSLSGPCSL